MTDKSPDPKAGSDSSLGSVTRALLEVLASGGTGALATLVRCQGSVPQRCGARLLLTHDDRLVGTVGGGRLEAAIIDALREVRVSGRHELLTKHLTRDLGMCCGGRVEVFVEPIAPTPPLLLFGAGHVGRAVAEFATRVGFDVTVIDDREDQNTEERFPACQRILMDPADALQSEAVRVLAGSYVVICTHDHRRDEETLRIVCERPHFYVGMIGSRRKVQLTFERLRARHPELSLDRVSAPIGLDINAQSPEEIGLAIVAELVQRRRAAP